VIGLVLVIFNQKSFFLEANIFFFSKSLISCTTRIASNFFCSKDFFVLLTFNFFFPKKFLIEKKNVQIFFHQSKLPLSPLKFFFEALKK